MKYNGNSLEGELETRIGHVLNRARDYSKNGVDFSSLMFSTESSEKYGLQVRLIVWYEESGVLGKCKLGKDYSANDYGLDAVENLERRICEYLEDKGLLRVNLQMDSQH